MEDDGQSFNWADHLQNYRGTTKAITGATCAYVTTNTDCSTVFVIKDPCSEMPAVRERVPLLLRQELYATLTASVIRLALRIYGQPGQLLARERIVNGADPDQRAVCAQLGQQAHLVEPAKRAIQARYLV